MGQIISGFLFQPPQIPTEIPVRQIIWLKTAKDSRIPAIFITRPRARYTLLYSHGNAEDLGMIFDYLTDLSKLLYINIMAYDYSGYGLGTQVNRKNVNGIAPSEYYCYADIDAAYKYLSSKLGVNPHNVILYGKDLGSGPSCYLAERVGCDGICGLVLHSPFLSVYRVVVDMGYTWKTGEFRSFFTDCIIDKLDGCLIVRSFSPHLLEDMFRNSERIRNVK